MLISLLSFQDRWEEVASDEPYQIFLDDEYQGVNNGDVMVKTHLNMAKKVVAALGKSGLKVTTTNIFNHLLSEAVILKIVEYTTECLVKFRHNPTYIGEYKRFLATRWLMSRFRLGLEQADVITYYISKRKGFLLLDITRFKHILQCTRGYPVEDKTMKEDDVFQDWIQHGILLRRFEELEKYSDNQYHHFLIKTMDNYLLMMS